MMERHLKMAIFATTKHCNSDCPGMSNLGSPQYCRYFAQPLVWDQRRTSNGNFRLDECKNAELVK
jgi:hypothetical protein